MRAVALALLVALPVSAQEPERVELDVPARVHLDTGGGFAVPEGSLILWPAEVARVDVRILGLEREKARLSAENASLREHAGQGGFSARTALIFAGVGALVGLGCGFVLAQ